MASLGKLSVLGDRAGATFCLVLGVTVAGVLGLRLRSESPTSAVAASTPATAPVTLQVEPTQTFQTIEGFGASAGYYQEWLAAHPERTAILQALFGELRLEFLRLRNTYEPGKPGFAQAEQAIFAGATQALGHPPKLVLASWSPPGDLKSSGSAKNGGTLRRTNEGGYDYAGFAHWWRASLVAYQQVGLAPQLVSIQNEPDWKDTWETCLFHPQETTERAGYDKALTAVSTALSALSPRPELIGPETLGADHPQEYLPPALAPHVAVVAHHLYNGGKESAPDSFLPRLHAIRDTYPDKRKFQTEFGRGDGFQTAWLIHNCLVEEEVSAYLYWASVWPGADALVTLENPWQRGSWKGPQGFVRTDRFWAMAHYSRFIAVGSLRVGVRSPQPTVKASAFVSSDRRSLTIVALNTAEMGTTLRALAPGYRYTEGYRTVFSSAALPQEPLAKLSAPADDTLELPARTLVTLVYTKQ